MKLIESFFCQETGGAVVEVSRCWIKKNNCEKLQFVYGSLHIGLKTKSIRQYSRIKLMDDAFKPQN